METIGSFPLHFRPSPDLKLSPLENLAQHKCNLFFCLSKYGKVILLIGVTPIDGVITVVGTELISLHMLDISFNPFHNSRDRRNPSLGSLDEERGVRVCPRSHLPLAPGHQSSPHSTTPLSLSSYVLHPHLQMQVYTLIKEQGPAWIHVPSGNFPDDPSCMTILFSVCHDVCLYLRRKL